MTVDQKINLIDWFRDIILAFENFFHQIQAWFEGTIQKQNWYISLTDALKTGTDAEKE